MHKRGLCRRAVDGWRCLSVTFVYCVETAIRYGHSRYRMRIGNRTQAIEWYHFQWPWVTLSDVAIFSDMKHRAASLRQLSFLWSKLFATRKVVEPATSQLRVVYPSTSPLDHWLDCHISYDLGVARWLSGRASDLRSSSRGFEARPRRCCVTTLG